MMRHFAQHDTTIYLGKKKHSWACGQFRDFNISFWNTTCAKNKVPENHETENCVGKPSNISGQLTSPSPSPPPPPITCFRISGTLKFQEFCSQHLDPLVLI